MDCIVFNLLHPPLCLSMFEKVFKKTFSAVLKWRPRSPIRIIDPESVAVLVKRVRITKSGADQDFSVEESSDGLSDRQRIIRKFSFGGFRRVDGDDGLDVRQAAVAANQVNGTLKVETLYNNMHDFSDVEENFYAVIWKRLH